MKKHRKRLRTYASEQEAISPPAISPLKLRLIVANLRCLVRMLEKLLGP